jgi:hypothetical protein
MGFLMLLEGLKGMGRAIFGARGGGARGGCEGGCDGGGSPESSEAGDALGQFRPGGSCCSRQAMLRAAKWGCQGGDCSSLPNVHIG